MGIPHFAPDGYHGGMIDETAIRDRFEAMRVRLDERERRLFAAAEARSAGYGGVSAVARATGIARSTIDRGLKDLAAPDRAGSKVRRSGGGRPALTRADPTLLEDLRGLLESTTLGDPTRPLIWVSKSHAKLALALEGLGHRVSATRIPQLLERLGYRRQVNRKSLEGGHHVDRNAQFEHINAQVEAFQAAGQPVISVDTKKKELVGDYKNGGARMASPKATRPEVDVHDFLDEELGKAIPYGVYDIGANDGWVSVGDRPRHRPSSRSTSIARWWRRMGGERYPDADRLLITADGGGSNGYRVPGSGRSSCRSSPTRPDWRSASATIRPARPSGTRSSTACSATSPRTGAVGRSPVGRRSKRSGISTALAAASILPMPARPTAVGVWLFIAW